jgi:hypothetical protein
VSIDIMNRLWWREDFDEILAPIQEEHPGSGKNLKWTLLAMADTASDDGFCWPAIETVARKSSLSRRAVQMAIRQAEKIGILKRRHRNDASTQYVFQIDRLPHVDRPRRAKERGPLDHLADEEPDLFGTGAQPAPVTGAGDSRRGAGDSQTGAGPAPRTINEPSEETSFLDSGDLAIARPPLDEYVEQRWHEMKAAHPGIADVRKIDDGLKHAIGLRASQHARAGEDGYAVWDEFFETVATSRFLTGRAPPGRDRDTPFKLSLPWALKAHNFREIIGGKYNGDRDPTAYDPDSGRRLGPTDQAVGGALKRMRDARERNRPGGGAGGYHPGFEG